MSKGCQANWPIILRNIFTAISEKFKTNRIRSLVDTIFIFIFKYRSRYSMSIIKAYVLKFKYSPR